MPDSVLQLRDVAVRYGSRPVVLDVERFDVAAGERVALIGPSGSGKTTLLRLVNGYAPCETGSLAVLGHEFHMAGQQERARRERALRRRVGFIFQSFNLVERATVFENVLWGRLGRVAPWRSLLGRFPDGDRRAAMAAIDEVGLVAQATQRADTLSGGQQQRVGVARVVAQEAELVLADEPISNLDPHRAGDVLELLVDVVQEHGATLVMSLHQPDLAQRHADRVIGLRGGKIVWDGPSERLDGAAIARIYAEEPVPQAPRAGDEGKPS